MTAVSAQHATDAETDLVTRTEDGPVTILTLNRPDAMNALSSAVLVQLQGHFDAIANDGTRALIIRGAGRGFCAGHDLNEMISHRDDEDRGRAFYDELLSACAKMMVTIRDLPVTVIAQVHGIATAAGCQLVAACDMAMASDVARFGVNGINAGLFCSTPMVALSRNISRKAAMEMLVLGEIIDAERACGLGLVNHVVAPEDLEDTTMAMAKRAASKSRAVVALGKKAFYAQLEMDLVDAYAYTSKVIVDNMMMRDAEIGINAFFSKSSPEWEDR